MLLPCKFTSVNGKSRRTPRFDGKIRQTIAGAGAPRILPKLAGATGAGAPRQWLRLARPEPGGCAATLEAKQQLRQTQLVLKPCAEQLYCENFMKIKCLSLKSLIFTENQLCVQFSNRNKK